MSRFNIYSYLMTNTFGHYPIPTLSESKGFPSGKAVALWGVNECDCCAKYYKHHNDNEPRAEGFRRVGDIISNLLKAWERGETCE